MQGIRQACHEAENKLGSAQSEIRALSDQTNELRERLAHTEESVTAERSQTASLKALPKKVNVPNRYRALSDSLGITLTR